ncbi:MAG: GNAT family N-acetyltransferase [Solobacterium sp.]|nr:GNAT family N-acetyltransferase [Solobacterium sp.]
MEKIELKRWPTQKVEALNDFYLEVNQEFCLVQIPLPIQEEMALNYLKAIETRKNGNKELLSFAIMLEEEIIGKIELNKGQNHIAELDLVIKEKYTNMGYGKEALKLLEEKVKETNWCRIIEAIVKEDNLRMKKLLVDSGYMEGRSFIADIVVPHRGNYRIEEVEGREYKKTMLKEA